MLKRQSLTHPHLFLSRGEEAVQQGSQGVHPGSDQEDGPPLLRGLATERVVNLRRLFQNDRNSTKDLNDHKLLRMVRTHEATTSYYV